MRRTRGDEFGFPPVPLSIATHHGFLDVVKCLVAQLGADANQATDTDFSTFLKAIQHNHIAIARYLHQKGADVNKPEDKGSTLVFWAAQEGETDRLELLVKELGVVPNQASNSGRMPVDAAGLRGHTRAVRKCVRVDARVGSDLLERAAVQGDEGLGLWLREDHSCNAPDCPESASKSCCKGVRYCSRACQKSDWARHKPVHVKQNWRAHQQRYQDVRGAMRIAWFRHLEVCCFPYCNTC